MKKLHVGFTMIELLIVISVLGILAVGLLAAVDPFEQLKKARDTNTRQSALSLQTSFIRYYATHGGLPWNTTSLATCYGAYAGASPAVPVSGIAISDADMSDCITTGPEGDGELKDGFVLALSTGADSMFVTSTTASSASVCFAPQSKSVRAEENVKYDATGVDTSAVAPDNICSAAWKAANPTDFATCFYCAK